MAQILSHIPDDEKVKELLLSKYICRISKVTDNIENVLEKANILIALLLSGRPELGKWLLEHQETGVSEIMQLLSSESQMHQDTGAEVELTNPFESYGLIIT